MQAFNFLGVDNRRIVLRGFSMGGAGAWHLGLHHPDRWCVIGPGAGFTTTKGYAGKLSLTPVQEKTLHIYDAVDYAENVFNVPIVAYSGADDPQKKAADNIEIALASLGLSMTHFISPKTGHTTPPEYQKKLAAEYGKHVTRGRDRDPDAVRFVTYTLRYAHCNWLYVSGLDRHYIKARVEAKRTADGFAVKTENVRRLSMNERKGPARPQKVLIDGQTLTVPPEREEWPRSVRLVKKDGKWAPDAATFEGRQKFPKMQGPIDDAFMKPFLCVRGSGTPWNAAVGAYARADLARFQAEWSKHLRGDLRIKDDKDVTEDDTQRYSLVLFGDPGSNALLAKVLPELPLTWTKDKLTWRGKEYSSSTHVPAFVYPSPLDGNRYVVINSGHTFHQDAFEGTNALLYPRLGDHALLRLTDPAKPLAMEVVTAGLFDEFWKFPSEGK
jgi:hypothetical protein